MIVLLLLESTEIRAWAAHAAKLVPSVLDRSRRSRMNCTRIEGLAVLARNSGRVLRRATATTCSEGASPGRTVRIHEPKDCHTSVGSVSYTHLRAHETDSYLVCRLLLEKKK